MLSSLIITWLMYLPRFLSVPEGLGVLTTYVQLWSGGGTGGVVATQSRILDKLSERNPAALCRHLSSCRTTAHKQEKHIMYGLLLPSSAVNSVCVVNRLLPGPAAACRLRFGSLVIRLVQIGLFPWRVLNGRARILPTQLAWWLLGWLQGLCWQLDRIWIRSAQDRRRERASRVHICQSERTSISMTVWGRTVKVCFFILGF